MARKKADVEIDDEVLSSVEKIEKDIEAIYGKGFILKAQSVIDEPIMTIPISPTHNLALGGGIPEGSWFVLNGVPKGGKTSTLLHFCANCQKEEYGGRDIYYLDIEGRLKKMNLKGNKNLNLDKFHIIRSVKKKILSAEEFLEIGLQILITYPGCVLVIDSISALLGENAMAKDISELTMGGTAAAQSRFVGRAANVVPINKNIVIAITHITASLAKYGSPQREKTSNALAYQADTKLKLKKFEPWTVGTKQIGQIITWQVVTSALGPPGMEYQSYLRYGHGLDEVTELITLASDLGIIKKAKKGAQYEFQNMTGEEKSIKGLEKTYKFFAENLEEQQFLQQQVTEMLQ